VKVQPSKSERKLGADTRQQRRLVIASVACLLANFVCERHDATMRQSAPPLDDWRGWIGAGDAETTATGVGRPGPFE